jgi:hypothetical protein
VWVAAGVKWPMPEDWGNHPLVEAAYGSVALALGEKPRWTAQELLLADAAADKATKTRKANSREHANNPVQNQR